MMKNIYLMIQAVRAEIAAIPALTDGDKGDITVSGSGANWTIDNTVVSNAKLSDVATSTFKGRIASGTGSPEDLTATQATSMLNQFTSSLKGLAPASGGGTTNFLRADGTWAAAQPALGFTAENVANKSTNLTSPDNTKYPTTLAVSTQFNDTRSVLGSKRTGGIWHTQTLGGTAPSNSAYVQTSVHLSFDTFEVDTTINAVAVEIVTTAGAAGSVLRLGLYKIASEDFASATLVGESGTIAADVTGFRQWTPGSPLSLTPGRYFWAVSHNSASNITFRNLPAAGCKPLGSSSNISTAYNIIAVGGRAAFGAMPSNISSFTTLTFTTSPPALINYRIA